MSIKCFYRVLCSGCGGYLDAEHEVVWLPEKALEFETWEEANRYAAMFAQWFDGHNGEYAQCTCTHVLDASGSYLHTMKCRVMQPRCVPLCPKCREACSD